MYYSKSYVSPYDNTVKNIIKNKQNTKKIMPSTPFCATCQLVGLPFELYTNHWTKSRPGEDGVVVCPTILNTICTLCNQKGHWSKYCKNIETPSNHLKNKNSVYPIRCVNSITDNNIIVNGDDNGDDNDDDNDDSECDSDNDSDITLDYEGNPIVRPPSPNYPPPDWDKIANSFHSKPSYANIVSIMNSVKSHNKYS